MGDEVRASDVGKVRYCPYTLVNARRGTATNAAAITRTKAGTARHDEVGQMAVNAQAAADRRCFVASYALGPDHPVTARLRRFRDQRLLRAPGGRVVVVAYYWLSPLLIRVLGSRPWFFMASRRMVVRLARRVGGCYAVR